MTTRQVQVSRLMQVASLSLAALMLLALVVFGPRLLNGADAAASSDLGNRLAACRSVLRAEIVDTAQNTLDTDRGKVALLTSAIVEAGYRQDYPTVNELLPQMAPARDAVDKATMARDAAATKYADLAKLSQVDTDAFLAHCQQ